MRIIIAIAALSMALAGCSSAPKPQRGGNASISLGGAKDSPSYASVYQPENPSSTTTQALKRTEKREDVVPVAVTKVTETPQTDGTVIKVTEHFAPQITKTEVAEESKTSIGQAHKDEAREIAARLSSFKGVQYFGFALVLAALAMFHPAVRVIIGGGKQVQMATGAVGIAMIFGPSVIVGREWLIAVVGIVGLLIYYLTSRLAYKEGQLDSTESK